MNQCKVVVVGNGNVGKTSLLSRVCDGTFPEEYIPTVFDNTTLRHVENIDGAEVTMDIGFWDTAIQESYDRLRPLSYPNTDIFLMCFSVVNMDSIRDIGDRWNDEISHFLQYTCAAKRILVGLKSDLNWMRYHHEKLVFGYVHQLDFFKELNVLDDCIQIILQYERLSLFRGCKYPIISDEMIEKTKIECGCDKYVELSARSGHNVDGLLSAITEAYIQMSDIYGKLKPKRRCLLL